MLTGSRNKRARLVRLLIYEGPSEWIETCIKQRGVKGSYGHRDWKIQEYVLSPSDLLHQIAVSEPMLKTDEDFERELEHEEEEGK